MKIVVDRARLRALLKGQLSLFGGGPLAPPKAPSASHEARVSVRTHVRHTKTGAVVVKTHQATRKKVATPPAAPRPAPPPLPPAEDRAEVVSGGDVRTRWVPADRRAEFSKQIEGLIKRADKLGVGAPTIRWTGATKKEHRVLPETAFDAAVDLGFEMMHEVEITGPTVKLPGWQLVAKLTPEGHGQQPLAQVYGNAEDHDIPKRYRDHSIDCEHCRTRRDRKRLFLVHKPESETWRAVGGACVKDYTGRTADQMVPISRLLGDFREMWEDEGWDGAPNPSALGYEPHRILQIASWIIDTHGWTSGSQAETSDETPTSELIKQWIEERAKGRESNAGGRPGDRTRHAERANQALAWLKDLGEQRYGGYLDKLQTVASREAVSFDHIGLLASAIPAWERAHEAKRKATASAGEGGLLGKVGDKFKPAGKKATKAEREAGVEILPPTAVRVTFAKTYENAFGTKTTVVMEDTEGRTIVWKASNRTNNAWVIPGMKGGIKVYTPMRPGAVFVIVGGTVKKQGEFGGVPNTEITRAKMVPMLGRGELEDEVSAHLYPEYVTSAWAAIKPLRALAKPLLKAKPRVGVRMKGRAGLHLDPAKHRWVRDAEKLKADPTSMAAWWKTAHDHHPATARLALHHALHERYPDEVEKPDPAKASSPTWSPSRIGSHLRRDPEAWAAAMRSVPRHWGAAAESWKARQAHLGGEAKQEAKEHAYESQGVEIDPSSPPSLHSLRGKKVWLYHGTTTAKLKQIRRSGLQAGEEESNYGGEGNARGGDAVYLTAKPTGSASADTYAKGAARRHGGDPHVLRVLVDGDDLQADPDDPDVQSGRYQYVTDSVATTQILEGLKKAARRFGVDPPERAPKPRVVVRKAASKPEQPKKGTTPKKGTASKKGPPKKGTASKKKGAEPRHGHVEVAGDDVSYRHPETGEERRGKVHRSGARGVSVVDHETGQLHRVQHGHYTAPHRTDEDADAAGGAKKAPAGDDEGGGGPDPFDWFA